MFGGFFFYGRVMIFMTVHGPACFMCTWIVHIVVQLFFKRTRAWVKCTVRISMRVGTKTTIYLNSNICLYNIMCARKEYCI